MTYRVVYTKAGGIFPETHDFAYLQAAEDWAALCRAGGWEAEVCEVPGTETAQVAEIVAGSGPGAPEGVGVAPRGRDEAEGRAGGRSAIKGDE